MGEEAHVEVAGVDDGAAGLKLVAGDGDGGEAAAHPGKALEDVDLTPGEGGGEAGGVVCKEEGGGGAGDAAADDADVGGGGAVEEGRQEEEEGQHREVKRWWCSLRTAVESPCALLGSVKCQQLA